MKMYVFLIAATVLPVILGERLVNNEPTETLRKYGYTLEDMVTLTTSPQEMLGITSSMHLNGSAANTTKSNATVVCVDNAFQTFLLIKKYMDPIIMGIIFIFGVISNITLLIILTRHKDMRTPSNACIYTMAIGDLLSVVVNVSLFYALLVSETWTVGVAPCKMLWFFSDFSVGLSIFSVAILSVQRYHGIVSIDVRYNNKPKTLRARIVKVCNVLLIWLLSFAFAIRTAITADVSNLKCASIAEKFGPDLPKDFAVLNLFVFCIAPLCVIAIFYSMTASFLIKSAKNMPGELSANFMKQVNSRKKGAKILLALTAVFFVSYVPWYTWQVIFFWGNFWRKVEITTYTYTILYYFFFANICFNTTALYCVSSGFRKYFNRYLFCRESSSSEKDKNDVPCESTKSLNTTQTNLGN